jgi:glycine/sarcosine/betaine reductase complex component A
LNLKFHLKERKRKMLKDKKVIAIGDRDGIPGPAIQAVCESAGAEVVFASTECFV